MGEGTKYPSTLPTFLFLSSEINRTFLLIKDKFCIDQCYIFANESYF